MSIVDDQYLKAISLFEQNKYSLARQVFEDISKTILGSDNDSDQLREDCLFNVATCLASEDRLKEALDVLSELNITNNDLLYNKALCHYKLQNYDEALQLVDQLITICHQTYPEFLYRSNTTTTTATNRLLKREEEFDDNSEKLQISHFIEGLNLRSAILFKKNGNFLDCKHCLDGAPYKALDQIDSITLHNQALYEHVVDLKASVDKLSFLCKLATDNEETETEAETLVPRESFLNLILINTFYNNGWQPEMLMEFMRENKNQIEKHVSNIVTQFIEIILEKATSSEDLIYRKLDKLLERVIKEIEKQLTHKDDDKVPPKYQSDGIGENKELAIIILMHQCEILWNKNQYEALERLLLKVEPQLKEEQLWKKSMAHTLYMLDTRFDDCVHLYEDLISGIEGTLLSSDPVVLGNLCVSYVLTGRNSDAEALIKDVESDEIQFGASYLTKPTNFLVYENGRFVSNTDIQQQQQQQQKSPPSHLTIINLIIGTLYCVKYNYEFGLTRLFKTLEPIEQKLHTKTWTEVKRCILALLDCHCKQMIYIKDDLFDQIVTFLISCEKYGVLIETLDQVDCRLVVNNNLNSMSKQELNLFHGRNSVTFEARYLRSIVLTVIHD